MRLSKYILALCFLMVFFVFIPAGLLAQGDPGCDPLCNCRADGSICPIDSGLYLLLAFGALYGIIKFWNQRKQIKLQTLNNK